MQKSLFKSALMLTSLVIFSACEKSTTEDPTASLDKLVVGTNITTANPVIGYVGTLKDLTVSNFTNTKSRQTQQYPYVTIYKNDVFVLPQQFGDVVTKYTRQADGTLAETGKITAPAASAPLGMVVESDTKAYCSLYKAGKILVINPSTMTTIRTIDLTSYGLGDSNPDPSVMELNNGKLYVACPQTTDGFTSSKPVQVLIIEVNNGDKITSVTDNRSTWAGSINEQKSLFFDELGDMYIFCVASYGFGGPSQKCGFLRIKKDQTTFDKDYFFNVADYKIDGIPANKVDYLQRFRYTSGGILYSTGNIYALASNPPDYIKDRTYGSFKVDVRNKTIEKLDLPYSNGYSACVLPYDNKILFGLATSTGVGIYTYDPATKTASKSPVVNTQGDPSILEAFK
jgi:hypothetical protein